MPQAASQGLWPGEEGLCACVGGCSRWGAAVYTCLCARGCVCVPTRTCKTSLLCVPEPCASQSMDGQARPLWAAYGAAERALPSRSWLPVPACPWLSPQPKQALCLLVPPPAGWSGCKGTVLLCAPGPTFGGGGFLGMVLMSLPGFGGGGGRPFLWGGTWQALVKSSLD